MRDRAFDQLIVERIEDVGLSVVGENLEEFFDGRA
jgi:hypothetical protein